MRSFLLRLSDQIIMNMMIISLSQFSNVNNGKDPNHFCQDEELWFNDEEDFDEEGSGPVLGPGGLGEPTKASCTSVSTTSPQAAAAATAALPCQEKVEAPSIVKVLSHPLHLVLIN